MPALYNLYLDKYLPEKFRIVGIGRSVFTSANFRIHSKKGVEEHSRRPGHVKNAWKEFSTRIDYIKADLENDKTYQSINSIIKKQEEQWKEKGTIIFYMSVAPQLAPVIAEKLHKAKLTSVASRSRMVFEKPV